MKTICSCIHCIACIVCTVFIIFIPAMSRGQVLDDFSDGNISENPVWEGDAAHFEINSAGQLHLHSAGSDTSVLFTRSAMVKNTEWSFWMKLSFNTSSNNHARIFLTADTSRFLSIVNACFLQAGGGDDSIFIMKQTGQVVSAIYRFKSYRTLHSTNTLRFKIRCDGSGNWEALIDTTGGHNYFSDGTFFDDSFTTGRWFGLMCRYTSSNAAKFYFDDFYVGPIVHDTVPPMVAAAEAATAKVIRITFSEPVQKPFSEEIENYQFLLPDIRSDSVVQDVQMPELVSIFLHDSLVQGTIASLRIRNIPDATGNRLKDTVVQVCYYQPKAYDILINEIMADPDPPVELPNGEYVELYNRSMFPINLQDWTFKFGSYSKVFPGMILPSKGYLVIARESAYLNFARCALLFTSSSSLSNEGTTLVLEDPGHHVIHSVTYSPEWYGGSFKEDGGWSLEMTDPSNPCGCMENWGPSRDAFGGTPGRANSFFRANPDETAPVVLRAVISDTSKIEVTFSESMDSISLLSPAGWKINHADGPTNPDIVVPMPPGFNSTKLVFTKPFEHGVTYTLNVNGNIRDCAGNPADTSGSIRFAIPDSVTAHDVVVNEILSNPASGGSRFVEIYNRSEKIIDLQTLVLGNRDTAGGCLADAKPLTSGGYLLFPGDYLALASSPGDICARYHPEFPGTISGMNGFPVFGDDTGTVILARKDNLEIIDRLQYSADMHYPLLATNEGVSLERTNPDLPAEDRSNWHSAAESAGFATPGYRNSHWIMPGETDREILIQPAVFSPDNDGRDDLLVITLLERDPDFSVNIMVYDSRGRPVRQIANNVLSGSHAVFIWDGTTAERKKAPMGVYILFIELTRPDGTVRKLKKTAVLGGRL